MKRNGAGQLYARGGMPNNTDMFNSIYMAVGNKSLENICQTRVPQKLGY